jgi:hypothetical protein
MKTSKAPKLAPLSENTIDRMEQQLLLRIESEQHAPTSVRSASAKQRRWMTMGGVAAAFVAGILIAPPLINAMSQVTQNTAIGTERPATDSSGVKDFAPSVSGDYAQLPSLPAETPQYGGREIVTSANATVRVNEIAAASSAIYKIVGELGGYVERTSLSESGRTSSDDIATPGMVMPDGDWGSMIVRVPSAELDNATSRLSSVGSVVATWKSQQDVTTEAIDLRARVGALKSSVERLTELMSKTETVDELITAESALAHRQAELDSYQQQLNYLEQQVEFSSLYIELQRIAPVTQADPAGFTDGLRAGWDGMMVSVNTLVIAAGFILPWLLVVGIAWLVVWIIRRSRRAASDVA